MQGKLLKAAPMTFRYNLKTSRMLSHRKQETKWPNDRESGGDVCQVCFSMPSNCLNLPCYHGGICIVCGLDFFRDQQRCPICMKQADILLQIERLGDHWKVTKGYYKAI